MQEWILPKLSDEVECLVHDLQAEQEQLRKEYVPLLEKDLRQRRKIGRHGSERT